MVRWALGVLGALLVVFVALYLAHRADASANNRR